MARRRHTSLTKRVVRHVIVRPVKTRIRKRKVARKRQKVAVAKAWQPVAKRPARGVKVARSQGGGRIVPWSASEAQRAQAKKALKAQARAKTATKAAARRTGMARPTTIEHGTNAGYHAHLANHSAACPACLEAHASYNRAHR